MKVITQYQCEICKKRYDTEKQALACEARGVPDLNKYPIGLMYQYIMHGSFVGIFSIAKLEISDSHTVSIASWAIRDSKVARYSLGDQLVGGSMEFMYTTPEALDSFIDFYKIEDKYVRSSEFKEMVEYLKKKKITPQYYNEKKELITL